MKKVLLILLLCIAYTAHSATLTQLSDDLRKRINESDEWTSNVDTLHLNQWIRHAEHRIATLSGYIPKVEDFEYTEGDLMSFVLSSDFRQIKKVFVRAKGRFYPVIFNPGFTTDTAVMSYDVVWNTATGARLLVKLGGFQDTEVDIIFNLDSSSYLLPFDFRDLQGVMAYTQLQWLPVYTNPFFQLDTNVSTYDIRWKHRDTARLYLRGQDLLDGDTVRVFYRKTLETGDTIKVEYRTIVPTQIMNVESPIPDDLENFIIEEAMGYYFLWRKEPATAARIWEQVRIDMGVVRPREQQ